MGVARSLMPTHPVLLDLRKQIAAALASSAVSKGGLEATIVVNEKTARFEPQLPRSTVVWASNCDLNKRVWPK
jgi:hypothetical protein